LEKGCTVQKTGRPIFTIYTCGMMFLRKELLLGVTMTVLKFSVALISTDSITCSASRRYLIYSEADFEVFRLAGATRCTDGGEIWQKCPPPCQISPHRCNDKGVEPQKLQFLLRFDQNVEYKRPTWAYPLHDFHKICRVYTPFQDALPVKIWLDLLEGLWSYGGFKLRGSGYPQIFSAP